MPGKIGLFYASTTGNTESVAQQIENLAAEQVQLHDIAAQGVAAMQEYDALIIGIPTWDFGELQEDWDEYWQVFCGIDFSGKKVALFGLGDQLGYGEWFLDAMGAVNDQVLAAGGEVLVPWPVEGYDFETSKALTADGSHFVGLALDEDCQRSETEARLQQWVPQVLAALLD